MIAVDGTGESRLQTPENVSTNGKHNSPIDLGESPERRSASLVTHSTVINFDGNQEDPYASGNDESTWAESPVKSTSMVRAAPEDEQERFPEPSKKRRRISGGSTHSTHSMTPLLNTVVDDNVPRIPEHSTEVIIVGGDGHSPKAQSIDVVNVEPHITVAAISNQFANYYNELSIKLEVYKEMANGMREYTPQIHNNFISAGQNFCSVAGPAIEELKTVFDKMKYDNGETIDTNTIVGGVDAVDDTGDGDLQIDTSGKTNINTIVGGVDDTGDGDTQIDTINQNNNSKNVLAH